MSGDEYDLERFVRAQDSDGTYGRVCDELRAGRKESHWMWFVFPQLAGLGSSAISEYFAITGLDEARAFLANETLGARLLECTALVLEGPSVEAETIFGSIDALKLRSSMTLFARAAPELSAFGAVIDRFFSGVFDPRTDALLG